MNSSSVASFSGAVYLDGTNSNITLNHATSIGWINPITMEMFVDIEQTGVTQILYMDAAFRLEILSTNYLQFTHTTAACAAPTSITSTQTVGQGKHHIAVTFDASNNVTFWIDGVSSGQTGSTAMTVCTVSTSRIGSDVASNYFKGYLDELRISSVTRYTSTFTPTQYPFDSDSSTTLLFNFDGSTSGSLTSPSTTTYLYNGNAAYGTSPFPL